MTTWPVQESDIEGLRKKGVSNVPVLQQFAMPGNENLIGLDPMAIIVHARNPVKTLTYEQIRGVYAGKSTIGRNLPGPGLPLWRTWPIQLPAIRGHRVCFLKQT